MSKKYVIEIKPEYEDTTKGVMVLGARESNLYVDTLSIENLEELNSDYINEHYGELQDEAYQRGYEEGKNSVSNGCDGCKWDAETTDGVHCKQCTRNCIDHYEPVAVDDDIKVGDEVQHRHDPNVRLVVVIIDILNDEISGFDRNGHTYSCRPKDNWCKTGRHFDIESILEEMKG